MSVNTIQIKLKINFPMILIMVLSLHAFFLISKGLPKIQRLFTQTQKNPPTPLKIRSIRTVGSKDSKIKSSTYLSKNDQPNNEIKPTKAPGKNFPLSFKDLAAPKNAADTSRSPKIAQRPGVRPEPIQEKKAINAISLKGKQIQKFMQDSSIATSASQLSGDPRTRSLNNSDVLVNLEVPEGVHPDELNKFELMFYGFQRRTAINYVNAFYKNLDKFQRENPHLSFPMTESKQVMTGRLTYDEKGNVKQIKMIRWTNVDRLQTFFEDVLKDMDTLHNPPKPLWSKTGEFSIFFSLVING